MRKTMTCFIVVACSCLAIAQSGKQWKVVQSFTLAQQTANLPKTVVFVPTSSGLYRLSAYISVFGQPHQNAWNVVFVWNDDNSGLPLSEKLKASSGGDGQAVAESGGYLFYPQAGVPLTYLVNHDGSIPQTTYAIGFTVEQLE